MEKYFIVLVFCLTGWSSMEQTPSPIVYDPTNGAQLIKILETMNEVRELNEGWKANQEFISKVIEDGKELKRLYSLLERMTCATDDLALFLEVNGAIQFCEEELEIDMLLGELEVISAEMKMLLQGAIVLTQFEAIKTLKDLNDRLEASIRNTNTVNAFFRSRFLEKAEQNYKQETAAQNVSWIQDINI